MPAESAQQPPAEGGAAGTEPPAATPPRGAAETPAGGAARLATPVCCSGCGRTEPAAPVTWTLDVERRGQVWLCEQCTRSAVRSIEGRLDRAWW